MTDWHVLTGEYPPQLGGVGDYTRHVARGLAATGDVVHIWAPPCGDCREPDAPEPGIVVHRLPDRFGSRSLRVLTRELDKHPDARLLLQYVPHSFGWRAANLPFCWWLRSRRRDSLWVMFHEVAFPFGRGETLSRNALAAVNRVMASIVASAAERVFVSIPGWNAQLRGLVRTEVEWLPVPSGIAVVNDPQASGRIRARHAGDDLLIGHFGTYGGAIRSVLDDALAKLLEISDARVLLLGRDSDRVAREIGGRFPHLRDRMHGTGVLDAGDVSRHVGACDLMLQPYPDGISSRRTSAMVSLEHARPMVTTRGWLTEPLWEQSGAVDLVDAGDPGALTQSAGRLLRDRSRREQLSSRARALYEARFDVRHTIAVLRSESVSALQPVVKLRRRTEAGEAPR
jgi:glycosyltransferase involved in cell wall biosynthesis